MSKLIAPVHFFNEDWKSFMDTLEQKGMLEDSFIYCDPPYLPDDNSINKTHKLYSTHHFNHEEFSKLFLDSISETTSVVISMSDSAKANLIYGEMGLSKLYLGEKQRIVNPQRMLTSTEVVFTNIII